ncbi:DUF5626 family protein [Konateibacter massiliensis]|uniref:DUF5626 family protein n=1 Tax=Konateibacter massiliensis TaxID=2002841 RepID=UPI000C147327|nr:DUF5626 family protein [Konateibacter massiliensis]
MTKSIKRKILGLVSTMAIFAFSALPAFAAEPTDVSDTTGVTAAGTISFENLKENPNQSYTGIDKNGEEYTISIEQVEKSTTSGLLLKAAASTTSWKVSYTSGVLNCYFYMDVSGNKCTSVYDKWILVIGGTYDNTSLTRSSSYGKLEFDVTGYGGIFTGTCWLKGTVTGSDNDINVSYQM